MLLAVDAGNTNIVFALFDGENIVHQWRMITSEVSKAEHVASRFDAALKENSLSRKDITGGIVGSVVPRVNDALSLFFAELDIKPFFVGSPDTNIGVDINVETPSEVGADRLVNVIAAFALEKGPSIVVDFGTATTFDVVADNGAYLGGLICPGIRLSLKALHDATAKLPHVPFQEPESKSLIGKTTEEHIQFGIYWGYVSMIEGLISRYKKERGECLVIATGGLASSLAHNCEAIDLVDQNLTLQGLRQVYELNKE
ncbi:MAG: type III pantothenate kinase [Sphingomonadales bacterium]|nr:type III pantothenate kinase [Sphingomonadales bacterium]